MSSSSDGSPDVKFSGEYSTISSVSRDDSGAAPLDSIHISSNECTAVNACDRSVLGTIPRKGRSINYIHTIAEGSEIKMNRLEQILGSRSNWGLQLAGGDVLGMWVGQLADYYAIYAEGSELEQSNLVCKPNQCSAKRQEYREIGKGHSDFLLFRLNKKLAILMCKKYAVSFGSKNICVHAMGAPLGLQTEKCFKNASAHSWRGGIVTKLSAMSRIENKADNCTATWQINAQLIDRSDGTFFSPRVRKCSVYGTRLCNCGVKVNAATPVSAIYT
ncbi:hypothetical protein C8J57DRAFT_1255659 [Mycena rebaudengoi]|nr:hypothetical protein C8J57DRAFT_1255659 [Mycena rebaudengoi]